MSLKKQIDEKLNQALKAKDKSTYPTLRLVVSAIKDAEIAMVSLGYKPQQASRAISQVLKNNPEIDDSEELIRFSLKSMI